MSNRNSDSSLWNVEAICRNAPYFIIAYFALHYVLRISISSNLEIDESQLVGATDWRLLYDNSHPPLYNWLSRIMLELTGWNWSLALPLLKNLLLMATYLLSYDLVKRVSGSTLSATIAVICLMLMPQIIWQSQITLTHSVLGTFAVIATLHAFSLMTERGAWIDYFWFALALSIGTLAKFNFFLFMGAFFIAIIVHARGRKILKRGKSLVSLLVYLALTGPVLITVIMHLKQSSERMQKLYKGSELEQWVDLPYLGIDGSIAMIIAILGSVGILLVAYFIAYSRSKTTASMPPITATDRLEMLTKILGTTLIIGLSAFLLIVFFGDMHKVHERYLTPLLILTPFLLVLKWPLVQKREAMKGMLRVAGIIIPVVYIGIIAQTLFGKHSLAIPYGDLAASLEKKYGTDLAIKAFRSDDIGNLVINLPSAKNYSEEQKAEKILMVWRTKHSDEDVRKNTNKLRETHNADEEVYTVKHGYKFNMSGDKQFTLKSQLFTLRD